MIRTTSKPRQPWGHDDYARPMAISLAAEPFAIPPADRDETAPTAPPVRHKRKRSEPASYWLMDPMERRNKPQDDEPQEVSI